MTPLMTPQRATCKAHRASCFFETSHAKGEQEVVIHGRANITNARSFIIFNFIFSADEKVQMVFEAFQNILYFLTMLHFYSYEPCHLSESGEETGEVEVFTSTGSIIEQTHCPKHEDEKFHNLKCLKRDSKDCGVHKLVLLPEEKDVGNHQVKWKRYDHVPTGKLTTDGKEIKKITLLEKCTGPKELFDYFIQLFRRVSLPLSSNVNSLILFLKTSPSMKLFASTTIQGVMPVGFKMKSSQSKYSCDDSIQSFNC